MAVDILGDEASNGAAMFCNTSMFAFGPVLNTRNEAEAFRQFCFDEIGDPRTAEDRELEELLGRFRREYPEYDPDI